MKSRHHRPMPMVATLLAAGLLAACSTPAPTTDPNALKGPRPGVPPGYLPTGSWVNSLQLLPPPPAAGSAQQAVDDEAYRRALAAKGSPRWQQAARDADYRSPKAVDAFSCALGVPISQESSPHLNMLMRRTLVDAGLATYRAKDQYKRARPFVAHQGDMCVPAEAEMLRNDGSYPSGHAAFGWAWGLILLEVAPDRADAIIQRARHYTYSRVACGVHWPSDVGAGHEVGAAVVAQLQSNADFRAQLREARNEVTALRAAGAKPRVDCAAEAAALR